MMLRYVFLVVLVLLAIVSIGSAFIWDDAGTTDYHHRYFGRPAGQPDARIDANAGTNQHAAFAAHL